MDRETARKIADDMGTVLKALNQTESLTQSNLNFLETTVGAGEWQVALDLIFFLIERKGVTVPEQARAMAYDLASRLKMDLDAMRADWPNASHETHDS